MWRDFREGHFESVGAGFLYLVCGDIMTIPGLPTKPGFYNVDIDFEDNERIVGLF